MSTASAYKETVRTVVNREERDALVMRHAELVRRIAHHLAGRLPPSVDVADLIQAGMLGLLEAAASYAEGHGATFETYAGIRIRGAMIDGLRKLAWAPRSVHRKVREVAAAVREIEKETGREAREAEIAARLSVSLEEYHAILQDAAGCRFTTLDEAVERTAADERADPFDAVAEADVRAALTRAIASLPERERLVMSLYYGEEMNLKEIGAVLNVTESRVCQLHGQALVRIRARLAR